MAALDPKKTYKHLKAKGFTDSVSNSPDHLYLQYFHEGKLVAHTKLSHGGGDIGDSLIGQMSRQCKLSKSDFMAFATCSMSQVEYEAALLAAGLL